MVSDSLNMAVIHHIGFTFLLVVWLNSGTTQTKKLVSIEISESEACPLVEKKKFYLETSLQLNWYAAYMHCRSLGWRLATINNKQENDALLAHIRAKYYGDGTYQQGIWLGGTEMGERKSWRWMATGQSWQFTDWLAGQPSNPESEHCLDLWTLKWNDAICDLPLMFVCEYNVYEPSCIH